MAQADPACVLMNAAESAEKNCLRFKKNIISIAVEIFGQNTYN